jgi:YD repeat-containing protein
MKNIHGNQKSLKLRDEEGRVVYKLEAYGTVKFAEKTYDKHGNELTFKDSTGFSYKYTRDKFGNVLTYKNSRGFSYKYTRDKFGNVLTFQ